MEVSNGTLYATTGVFGNGAVVTSHPDLQSRSAHKRGIGSRRGRYIRPLLFLRTIRCVVGGKGRQVPGSGGEPVGPRRTQAEKHSGSETPPSLAETRLLRAEIDTLQERPPAGPGKCSARCHRRVVPCSRRNGNWGGCRSATSHPGGSARTEVLRKRGLLFVRKAPVDGGRCATRLVFMGCFAAVPFPARTR